MKIRVFAIILAVSLLFAVPAMALDTGEFRDSSPTDAIVLEDGSVLVTDTWNKVIWRVSDEGTELFAGNIGVKRANGEPIGRYNDGDKAHAYFMEPYGIAPYLDGYAVTDASANVVR